ncbi:hypothetical protein OG394_37575 [Kribbella sp. NBC_01245]|uniref:hypothetical protein n=1 Tax=Kribbella sp. NBC_01245 TaxID=2903578 RepID=UPI002E2CD9D5|nr:hypothetical protein [Kribbella sp. NBC_01245]
MKGAFVLANDTELYEQIERVLIGFGARTASDRTAQIEDDSGYLFTVFGDVGPESEADLRAAPIRVRGDVSGLDQASATACWVECRSEDVFVQWVRTVSAERMTPTWVLDGDGVIWNVEAVDPDELQL